MHNLKYRYLFSISFSLFYRKFRCAAIHWAQLSDIVQNYEEYSGHSTKFHNHVLSGKVKRVLNWNMYRKKKASLNEYLTKLCLTAINFRLPIAFSVDNSDHWIWWNGAKKKLLESVNSMTKRFNRHKTNFKHSSETITPFWFWAFFFADTFCLMKRKKKRTHKNPKPMVRAYETTVRDITQRILNTNPFSNIYAQRVRE